MTSTTPAQPTLQGIPGEIRNHIYELVAAATTETRTILGRKLAQAVKRGDHDGDIRKQALSVTLQHPLSMTCRQIRAEFSRFHDTFVRSKTGGFEFVVNNFDVEQMQLFEKFNRARRNAGIILVKAPTLVRRDIELSWLKRVSIKVRFQMDNKIASSAAALDDLMELCRTGKERDMTKEGPLPVVQDYTLALTYRDFLTGVVDTSKTVTVAQAKEVHQIFSKWQKCRYRECNLPRDGSQWRAKFCFCHEDAMLDALLTRFTSLLSAYMYRASQHKEELALLATQLGVRRGWGRVLSEEEEE